jgi:small-conductance mechanosensitive channel
MKPAAPEAKHPLTMRLLLMVGFIVVACGLYAVLRYAPVPLPPRAAAQGSVQPAAPTSGTAGTATVAPSAVASGKAVTVPGETGTRIDIGHRVLYAVFLAFLVAAIFEALCLGIALVTRWKKGSKGDVAMLVSLTRVVAVIAVLLIIIAATGKLTLFSSVVGAFAGMLLGWSLQAPVSGIAAWVLVSIKRPFRIGDRVQFPNLNLVGDVMEVGLMYTKLNQVGGSVGSEDAIGRHILIPNAMLFSQVAINYTPVALMGSTYCLDEVVIRLTYDSDWDEAERILLACARQVTDDIIQATGTEPYIRADNWDYGVFMRLRFMTLATDRPRISHEILREIFRQVQKNPLVDFAIPFIYSYRKGMEGASAGRPAPARPVAEREIAMDNIDDPEAGAPSAPEVEARVTQLAERIGRMGLLQSIVVERMPNGRYRLLAGRLRYIACHRLGWKVIPAVVREGNESSPVVTQEGP